MKTKIDLKFEEDVYRKYYPLVYATCKRFLVEKAFLEDATQSVFLLYIKKEDSISSNLSSWFYWASVNICKVVNKDTKKHLEKSTSLNENAELTNEHQSQEEFFLDLGGILEKLPTKKRDMLMMRYYENKTYVEIGSFYKCHEDNIRKMIDRTILQLKNEVKRKEVFSSVVFAQLFGLDSASPIIPAGKSFILQNSLLQQSFIKGVQKMYLITKLKMAIVCVCLSIPLAVPLSTYLFADNDEPTVTSLNKELLTPEVLAMTDSALKYLAEQQADDGSWSDTQYNKSTGVTALSCLAFMAEGSLPRVGKYGKNLDKGLDFLLQNIQVNGVILAEGSITEGPMYEHGLASIVLLLSQEKAEWHPQIQGIIEKSVEVLSKCQKIDGGWGFDFTNKGYSNMASTSNVLWFLKLSEKFGYTVPKSMIDKGVQYLVKCAYPDGHFRYRYFGLHSLSMNCLGIIALTRKGNLDHPLIGIARDVYLFDFNRITIDDMKARPNYLFDCFYASVAMYSLGGTYWNTWFPREVQFLKAMQRNDGSVHDENENSIYSTAMSAIILQAPNGKLSLYERGLEPKPIGKIYMKNPEK